MDPMQLFLDQFKPSGEAVSEVSKLLFCHSNGVCIGVAADTEHENQR